MPSIRLGKDITILWKVLTNKKEEPLEGRDLKLFVVNPRGIKKTLDFTIDGVCTIKADYYGKDHKELGTYSIELWENYQKVGQSVVDYTNAFTLVEHSSEEVEQDTVAVKVSTKVSLATSGIATGIVGNPGKDADIEGTEIAKKEAREAAQNANNEAEETRKVLRELDSRVVTPMQEDKFDDLYNSGKLEVGIYGLYK